MPYRSFLRCSQPRLERAGTKLSYCNGEIGAGSSNITPYMVWACKGPRWVAHTLQQLDGFWVETGRRPEGAREHNNVSAGRSMSAMACCTVAISRAGPHRPRQYQEGSCP